MGPKRSSSSTFDSRSSPNLVARQTLATLIRSNEFCYLLCQLQRLSLTQHLQHGRPECQGGEEKAEKTKLDQYMLLATRYLTLALQVTAIADSLWTLVQKTSNK